MSNPADEDGRADLPNADQVAPHLGPFGVEKMESSTGLEKPC